MLEETKWAYLHGTVYKVFGNWHLNLNDECQIEL